MKKALSLILALILLLSLCACGENDAKATDPTTEPAVTDTQAPTEEVTEAPTETPTEAPTEAPTETPTEAPTEAPATCAHTYKDATCDKPKTCTLCGATEGKAAGHNWKDATCDKPKTCTRCKTTTGSATNKHTLTAKCTVCGKANAGFVAVSENSWTCAYENDGDYTIATISFYGNEASIGYTRYTALEKIAADLEKDINELREEYEQMEMLKVIDGKEYGYNGWGMDNWSKRVFTEKDGVVTISFQSLNWDNNDNEIWMTEQTAVLTRTGLAELKVTGGDYFNKGLKFTPDK